MASTVIIETDGKTVEVEECIKDTVTRWVSSYKRRKPEKYANIHSIEAQTVCNGRFIEIGLYYKLDDEGEKRTSQPFSFRLSGPNKRYYQAREWFAICERVKERDGFRCVLCNSDKNLVVHHRTYKNFGNENLEDLVTLCLGCHKIFHDNRSNWTNYSDC